MILNILWSYCFAASTLKPEVPIQDSIYPSGVKDADKAYASDKPGKDYPLLKFDLTAYDPEFNKIEPGFYSVEYSPEFNMLLIGNGMHIIKSPAFQVIKLNQKVHIPSANVSSVSGDKVFLIYKNRNLEIQSFLYLPAAVLDNIR